jgi:hypothetical protein
MVGLAEAITAPRPARHVRRNRRHLAQDSWSSRVSARSADLSNMVSGSP